MRCTSLLLLVTLFLTALPGCAPKLSAVITVLKPVERELNGTEPQNHKIHLPADKYFRIEIEQIGIDAIVELRGPNENTITTVNTPTARVGSELLMLETTISGDYQLLVRSNEYVKKEGRYRLTIEELSNKTRSDRHQLKAEQAMSDAAQLNFEIAGANDSSVVEKLRADAIEQYKIARDSWNRLHSTEQQAWTLYCMAAQYYQLLEWKLAAEFAADASTLFRKIGDKKMLATALQRHGMALIETHEQADFEIALNSFSEALKLQRASENRYSEAETINNVGLAYFQQGELAKARKQFVKASDIFNTLGEPQQAIWTLNNIASIDRRLGNYPSAISTFEKALGLPESSEYQLEQAGIIDNLADAYAVLGNLQEALVRYREAADLFELLGDRMGKARALSGIGFTYGRLGSWRNALGFFEQALALQQGPAENRALVTTHMDIGNAYRMLDQPSAALKAHNQALELAKLPVEKTSAYIELGRDYTALGDHSAAIDQYNQALKSATGDEAASARAFALQELGRLKVEQDIDVLGGVTDLQAALQLHRTFHAEAGEAQTLQALARADHKLGRVDSAIQYAEQALDIIEALRIRVGSPNLRLSFTGLQLPTYELHIALLMELANSQVKTAENAPGYAALALEASERAHARSLVELLNEARTDDNQGIDLQLLRARNEKRQELASLAYRLEQLAAEGNSDITKVQIGLQVVQADLDVIEAKIRKQNRQYAELTQPRLLSAMEIQNLLTPMDAEDKNTVLLEYSLGEEQSFLWFVTKNSIESWTLPGRAEIEVAAREAYDKLKTLDQNSASRHAEQRALARLAKMILAPVMERLQGQRVVVVPDGALQYIPFSVLPISHSGKSTVPLLEQHEIVILPSASTLALLRTAQRQHIPAKKSIAIFADPIFNQQDTRLPGNLMDERHASTRSSEERGRDLLRLPASGREADNIASLAAPAPVLMATGFAANKSRVLNAPLAEYRYIHFATHGLINSQYPQLSSLALSAFDENGAPQQGFLRLHDIYGLKLNAKLVVISACEAALGKDIRGEGLIGLTRGFMYAGTPSVVASLWRASDEATAELMQEFYRHILKQGLTPADALRKAQLSISSRRKWRDPYYWAGFVLQGDWN